MGFRRCGLLIVRQQEESARERFDGGGARGKQEERVRRKRRSQFNESERKARVEGCLYLKNVK